MIDVYTLANAPQPHRHPPPPLVKVVRCRHTINSYSYRGRIFNKKLYPPCEAYNKVRVTSHDDNKKANKQINGIRVKLVTPAPSAWHHVTHILKVFANKCGLAKRKYAINILSICQVHINSRVRIRNESGKILKCFFCFNIWHPTHTVFEYSSNNYRQVFTRLLNLFDCRCF